MCMSAKTSAHTCDASLRVSKHKDGSKEETVLCCMLTTTAHL